MAKVHLTVEISFANPSKVTFEEVQALLEEVKRHLAHYRSEHAAAEYLDVRVIQTTLQTD